MIKIQIAKDVFIRNAAIRNESMLKIAALIEAASVDDRTKVFLNRKCIGKSFTDAQLLVEVVEKTFAQVKKTPSKPAPKPIVRNQLLSDAQVTESYNRLLRH